MPASFNKGEYGLVPCRLEVVEGLIFLCLDEDAPADLNRSHGAFLPYLKLHGTAGARIAHHEQWTVKANWKLLYENFGECYHCAGVHPEFLKLYRTETLAAFGAGPASAGVNAELAGRFSAWAEKAEELGHHTASVECNGDGNYFSYAARAPFDFDALTLSADGKPLAPLMKAFSLTPGLQVVRNRCLLDVIIRMGRQRVSIISHQSAGLRRCQSNFYGCGPREKLRITLRPNSEAQM